MENIFTLNNIIGAFINSFAYIYLWTCLLNEKIRFKSYKYYIIQIVFALTLMLNYLLVNDILRIFFLLIMMLIFSYFLYKKDFISNIVAVFVSQLVMMLAEIIFAIFITVVLGIDANNLIQYFAGALITNTTISICAILLSRIKLIKQCCNLIEKMIRGIETNQVFFIMILSLISINFIFLSIYYKYSFIYVFIINGLISIFYLVICFKFLTAQNKYHKINDKYNNTLNSLKEYEEILDVYRVSSHENKNELLTIRSMIVKKEQNIPEYIDKIIDNKIKDDEKLMFDTNTIPAGGLRAVVYSKLLIMKDKKIKFDLNVDRKVRTVELIELGEDMMLDICKIVGVFLDNAIEAVSELKQKYINITLFTDDDYLNIEISNNFKGSIDLTIIDEKGYTSKSQGHGYGLTLVKQIISKNNKLGNERKINRDIFTQNLKIKIK